MENLQPKLTIWEANPKLKMLLLILIFVFLLSGIGLTLFDVWSNNYREKIYEETQAVLLVHKTSNTIATTTTAAEPTTAGWKTYKNDQYGFELTFTDNWKGFEVKDQGKYLDITVPGVEGANGSQVRVFSITVLPLAEWNGYIGGSLDMNQIGFYLGQNKKYVFGYDLPQDRTGIPPNVVIEMQQVINTFKFTQAL